MKRVWRLRLGEDVRAIDYRIGQVVYQVCRDEPVRGLVTGYKVCPDDLLYAVTWPDRGEQFHYSIELSAVAPGDSVPGPF
jgi:hypothetical protein